MAVGGATTLQMVHMQHTVCAICIWYAFQVLVNHQMESMSPWGILYMSYWVQLDVSLTLDWSTSPWPWSENFAALSMVAGSTFGFAACVREWHAKLLSHPIPIILSSSPPNLHCYCPHPILLSLSPSPSYCLRPSPSMYFLTKSHTSHKRDLLLVLVLVFLLFFSFSFILVLQYFSF